MKDLRAAFHGQRREKTAYSPNTPVSPDLPPSFPIWYLLKSDAVGTLPLVSLPGTPSLLLTGPPSVARLTSYLLQLTPLSLSSPPGYPRSHTSWPLTQDGSVWWNDFHVDSTPHFQAIRLVGTVSCGRENTVLGVGQTGAHIPVPPRGMVSIHQRL